MSIHSRAGPVHLAPRTVTLSHGRTASCRHRQYDDWSDVSTKTVVLLGEAWHMDVVRHARLSFGSNFSPSWCRVVVGRAMCSRAVVEAWPWEVAWRRAPFGCRVTRAAQAGDIGSMGACWLGTRPACGRLARACGVRHRHRRVVQDAAWWALRPDNGCAAPVRLSCVVADGREPTNAAAGGARRQVERGAMKYRALPSNDPMLEELLDRQPVAEWVWHAIEELSPQCACSRCCAISDLSSYEQIAARMRAAV